MGKYKLKDFGIGDKVYHLSNTKLKMVAIEINEEINEVVCRWLDNDGKVQAVGFMPEELGKASDLGTKARYIT